MAALPWGSTYAPDPNGGLNPEDFTYFQVGRRRLKSSYDLSTQQNDLNQATAGYNYTRDTNNLLNRFDQQRTNVPGHFAASGTLNSGLYKNAVNQFNDNEARQLQVSKDSQDQRNAGYGQARQQLTDTYWGGLSDLFTQEDARRAAAAILGR